MKASVKERKDILSSLSWNNKGFKSKIENLEKKKKSKIEADHLM